MPFQAIPVVDIFAGPGGLSEGFSAMRDASGKRIFEIKLSIEKDPWAHRTLELRAFFRSFDAPPPEYFDYLRGNLSRDELFAMKRFSAHARAAAEEAWCLTLSQATRAQVKARLKALVRPDELWVLIGGPPCQAYSVMGRSRMRSVGPRRFEEDERHFLYREYLAILSAYTPPVFVFENVRGLLSSKIGGRSTFQQILADLSRPGEGTLRYRIVPLTVSNEFNQAPEDYLVKAEEYGVPQARHRVILCGIRDDLPGSIEPLVRASRRMPIEAAIYDLPPIRSRLSREEDSASSWLKAVRKGAADFERYCGKTNKCLSESMREFAAEAARWKHAGAAYVGLSKTASASHQFPDYRDWVQRDSGGGVTGHDSRAHMNTDLSRYLFAASFAAGYGYSPPLREFPRYLIPHHENAKGAPTTAPFQDRFRVQVRGKPSTTIVSHIGKDGHYFIHPDASQCRSLTLREAARLQTFPDNYHFEGNRTQQLVQVGNAVPPYLASQIAGRISEYLRYLGKAKKPTSMQVKGPTTRRA